MSLKDISFESWIWIFGAAGGILVFIRLGFKYVSTKRKNNVVEQKNITVKNGNVAGRDINIEK